MEEYDLKILNNFELIKQYCSDTVVELKLFYDFKHLLNGTTIPFKNVEKLSLTDSQLNLGYSPSLPEQFPAVRYLELSYDILTNVIGASLTFPKLEHIHIEHPSQYPINSRQVEMDLIRSNPSIQTVSFEDSRQRLPNITLKVVDGKLVLPNDDPIVAL